MSQNKRHREVIPWGGRESMVGRISGTGRFWGWWERLKDHRGSYWWWEWVMSTEKTKSIWKCWAHSPLRAAASPFTRCRYRYCRAPPAHRCPRRQRRRRWRQLQRQRQRVTEGTAMAPWNGPNDATNTERGVSELERLYRMGRWRSEEGSWFQRQEFWPVL